VAARLAHVLGAETARHSQDGGLVRARLEIDAEQVVRDRLTRGGFPAAGPGRHGSADPGRPVEITLG
jgi:hypothetical protein